MEPARCARCVDLTDGSAGFIDTSVTSNPITYTPVDKYASPLVHPSSPHSHSASRSSQGFWQVQSTSWSLNGTSKPRLSNTTILDTGTTLLLVADDVVDEIYGAHTLHPSPPFCLLTE